MTEQNRKETIRVWDPLVRLFHWSLLAAFAVAYFTQDEFYELHLDVGYVIIGLVVFRLLWGFVGPRYARFVSFVTGPSKLVVYLRSMAAGQATRHIGHNPAGGAMIVLLILSLLVVTISGVALDAAENRAGPLSDYMLFIYTDIIKEIHVISTNVMLGLIALHVIGVIVSSRAHKENLVLSMITGRKRAPSSDVEGMNQ